ncbi:hypothetical protein ACNOYE_29160 [Nannocystaceae bacterium ST9]
MSTPEYIGFDLAFRSLSLQAAAELRVSSIFDGSGGGKGLALLFDALLRTEYSERVVLPSGFAYIKRKGTGLRVAMKMITAEAKAATTFAGVAAQTTLGMATTNYKIEGIALSESVIDALLDIPISGQLSEQTFRGIQVALSERLPTYLESADIQLGEYSEPASVDLDKPGERARSINYAMSMIARRVALSETLTKLPPTISRETVVVTYARFTGSVDTGSTRRPSPTDADAANLWLSTGSLGT